MCYMSEKIQGYDMESFKVNFREFDQRRMFNSILADLHKNGPAIYETKTESGLDYTVGVCILDDETGDISVPELWDSIPSGEPKICICEKNGKLFYEDITYGITFRYSNIINS